jgi:hypothetical protein
MTGRAGQWDIEPSAPRSTVRPALSPSAPIWDQDAPPRGPRRRRRGVGLATSVVWHAVMVVVLLSMTTVPQKMFDPQPIAVALVDARDIFPAPKPVATTAPPSPAKAPSPKKAATARRQVHPKPIARRNNLHRAHAAHATSPMSADDGEVAHTDPGLSDAEIAGASTAGEGEGDGGGGRPCNMAHRLQVALRKDPMVQESVAGYAGKAIMVWNGDWVWFHGDIGKGLTAVRQAMMWEIAFAPEACRTQPMHGMVLLSSGGSARLAVGSGEWRWSDLLRPHGGVVGYR